MPRCLMAKKWKAYPWTADGSENYAKSGHEDPLCKKEVAEREEEEEEDEEIDVVTIQLGSETKPIIQFQPEHIKDRSGVTIEHNTPIPPRNYYQTSAEDYPSTGSIVNDPKCQMLGTVAASVIQQHTSNPTPQVRLTSVIHHSGSFLTQNTPTMQQSSQSSMHHSASPMQPQSSWGPSSPTEGATAPSPPPHIQHSSDSDITTAIHYNGKLMYQFSMESS